MHSQQLTTSYPVLVCLLNTGTLIQSAMLGFNSIFRLSCTVLQFHYISGCCDHSASWARGAVHIPVYSSPPSCQPAAPSSVTTTSVTGSKKRYAAITSNGRHRPQQSSSLPPMEPLSKAAREQEEYQQVLELRSILLHRWVRYLDSFKNLAHPRWVRPSKLLAFAKSSLQPRHLPVPFEHTICRSRDF